MMAAISANNDIEIGNEIAEAVEKVGKEAMPRAWPMMPWGMIMMRQAKPRAGMLPMTIDWARNWVSR